MGNFEKLSVVVIVVIIVMILAVAVVEWTSGPAETQPTNESAVAAAVPEPPPRVDPPKSTGKRGLKKEKEDPASRNSASADPILEWTSGSSDIQSLLDPKPTDLETKTMKVEPVAPPAPAPGSTPDIAETTHVVASGETLGAIAKKHYDRVSLWTVIVDANPGLRPESLRPGQTLKIPAKKGVPIVTPGPNGASSAGGMLASGTKPVPGKEYTVRASDTWERISSAAYNTSARWPEIYLKNLNRVKDQKDLPPGKVIMIPK